MISVSPAGVEISGPLTHEAVASLARAPQAYAEAAPADGVVAVDLAGVTAVDSSAVAFLLAVARAAQARGARLAVRRAPDALASLARLYGVAELLGLPAA